MSKGKRIAQAESGEVLRYTLEIMRSDEDGCYVVVAPEWHDRYMMPIASGKTYEDAARRGRNALENMIAFARERGEPLPEPRTFAPAGA